MVGHISILRIQRAVSIENTEESLGLGALGGGTRSRIRGGGGGAGGRGTLDMEW